jgi:hypothetical protein
MRPLDSLMQILDRTLVLFIGLAVGGVIASSFVGRAATMSQARASAPLAPAAAPLNRRVSDPVTPRLAAAVAQHRKIEIGVFGDSFGDGIWAGLYNKLRRDDRFEVLQFSERSTGFTRYRSLNLLDDITAKTDRQPIDIAVVSYGANDTQGIFDQGHGNPYMSPGWQRIVTERVTAVVRLLRDRGAMVYWVGLPKMRDPHFDTDVQAMNQFYAARMAALDVPYVETLPMSVDAGGNYEAYLPAESGRERQLARTNDGIHMTIPGYIKAVGALSDRIRGSLPQAAPQADAQAGAQAASAGAPRARSRG